MGAFIAHYREADYSPTLTSNNDSDFEKTGKGSVLLWHHDTDRYCGMPPRVHDIYSWLGAREISLRYSRHFKCEYLSVHPICRASRPRDPIQPDTRDTRDEHIEASICAHLCGPCLRGCRFPWQMGLGFKVFGIPGRNIIVSHSLEPRTDRTRSNTSERLSTPRQAQLTFTPFLDPPSWPSVDIKTRHLPDCHHRGNVTRPFFFPFRPIASESSSLPPFLFLSSLSFYSDNDTSLAAIFDFCASCTYKTSIPSGSLN
jgi:hypothetical protein